MSETASDQAKNQNLRKLTDEEKQKKAITGSLSDELKAINEAGDLTPEDVRDRLNDLVNGNEYPVDVVRQELLNYTAINGEYLKSGTSNLNKYITEEGMFIEVQNAAASKRAGADEFREKYLKDNIDTSTQPVPAVDQTELEQGESFISLTQQTHQCILTHYLDTVSDFHRKQLHRGSLRSGGATNPFLHRTIAPSNASDPAKIILISDGSPDSSLAPVNSLTSLGKTDVHSLLPADLAKLMPSLRLYKIYRSEGEEKAKVEFKFSNKTDSGFLQGADKQDLGDFIMDAGYAKGSGAGIKSFNWSFIGGDPFTATRDLTATLKIFFQDFRDLTEVRTDSKNLFDPSSENPKYRYLDLVLQADCRDNKPSATSISSKPADGSASYDEFNPECYEIAVEVGYADTPDLPAGMKSQTDTLYLTMVEHSFDIGQDGTFELTIDYRARLASLLGDKGMNVLAPAGGHMVSTFITAQKGMAFDLREVERQIQQEEREKNNDEEYETEDLEALRGVKSHLLYLRNNSLYRSICDTLLDESLIYKLEVPDEVFAKFTNFNKYDRNKKVLIGLDKEGDWQANMSDISVAGGTPMPEVSEGSGAIVDEDAASEEALETATQIAAAEASSFDDTATGSRTVETQRFARLFLKENIYFTTLGNILAVAYEHVSGEGSFNSVKSAGDLDDLKKAFKAANKKGASEHEKELAPVTSSESGVDIGSETDPFFGAEKVPVDKAQEEILKRFRIILGAATYIDARTGKQTTINLAHLPISMQMFRQFMIDRVISQNRTFYSLQDFTKDLLTDIVFDSLNRICFGGYGKDKSSVRAGISFISGQGRAEGNQWVEPISSNTEEGVYADRIDPGADQYIYKMLDIGKTSRTKPIFTSIKSNTAREFNYLMFSALSVAAMNAQLHGDESEDADSGIAHFRYGSTKGLMKTVNFTKTPIEYLAEERYVREGSDNLLNQLAGRYEMQMNMVGNNMFIPGQYVYFDPVALGIGKTYANKKGTKSLANLMGLGGYHIVTEVGNSIAPGKFETSIKALWETGGTEKK